MRKNNLYQVEILYNKIDELDNFDVKINKQEEIIQRKLYKIEHRTIKN